MPFNADTGLLAGEQECMDHICAAYAAFLHLDRQHPDELRDFVDAVHKMQDQLALRVVRRSFPKGWPTHSQAV